MQYRITNQYGTAVSEPIEARNGIEALAVYAASGYASDRKSVQARDRVRNEAQENADGSAVWESLRAVPFASLAQTAATIAAVRELEPGTYRVHAGSADHAAHGNTLVTIEAPTARGSVESQALDAIAEARGYDRSRLLAVGIDCVALAPVLEPVQDANGATVAAMESVGNESSVRVEWFDTASGGWFDMGEARSIDAARERIAGLIASDARERMGARYRIVCERIEEYRAVPATIEEAPALSVGTIQDMPHDAILATLRAAVLAFVDTANREQARELEPVARWIIERAYAYPANVHDAATNVVGIARGKR